MPGKCDALPSFPPCTADWTCRMEGQGCRDEENRRRYMDRGGLPVRHRGAGRRYRAGRGGGPHRRPAWDRRAGRVRTGPAPGQRPGTDPRRSAAGDGQAVVEHRAAQYRRGVLLAARLAGDHGHGRGRAGRAAGGAPRDLQQPRRGARAAGHPGARGCRRGHRDVRGRTTRLHHLLDARGAGAGLRWCGRRARAARGFRPVPGRAARAVPVLSARRAAAGHQGHERLQRAAAVRRVGRRRAARLPARGAAREPCHYAASRRQRLPGGAAAAHHRPAVHAERGLAHGAAGRNRRPAPGREGALLGRRGPGGPPRDHHLRARWQPARGPDAAAGHLGVGRGRRGGHRALPAA